MAKAADYKLYFCTSIQMCAIAFEYDRSPASGFRTWKGGRQLRVGYSEMPAERRRNNSIMLTHVCPRGNGCCSAPSEEVIAVNRAIFGGHVTITATQTVTMYTSEYPRTFEEGTDPTRFFRVTGDTDSNNRLRLTMSDIRPK